MKRYAPQCCSDQSADRSSQERSAFTLLELLLVLAVLTTFVALSWPGLMKSIRQQRVQDNVEQVRQVMDKARVRAVEEGRTLQFRFEPHGRHYVVLPVEPMDEAQKQATTSGTTSTTFSSKVVKEEPFHVYEVSADCYFHVDSSLLSGEPTVAERLGDAWTPHLENPLGVEQISWSRPILYYPDGSATDGSAVVMDQDKRYVKLHVRGLTGAVWSEPLAVLSDRLGQTGQ